MRSLSQAIVCFLTASGSLVGTAWSDNLPKGELIGRVELVPGMPLSTCRVLVEGTPIEDECDSDGAFDIRNIPRGRWDLRIIGKVPGTDQTITKRIGAGANGEEVTDLGVVVLSPPLTVAGRVNGVDATTYGNYFVTVPSLGIAAPLSANGTYLLSGLPPAPMRIEVREITRANVTIARRRTGIMVKATAGSVAINEDLDVTANRNPGLDVPSKSTPGTEKPSPRQQ